MVIGIIGLLAALLTPVVMRSLTKARNAAIKAEIDMIHMAIMNYQSEYGVLPPCVDSNMTILQPGANYTYGAGGQAAKHLRRLFPRVSVDSAVLQLNSPNNGAPRKLLPNNAIVAWLSGFTTNPASPLSPASDRVKLYDADKSRIDSDTAAYFPAGKRGSPYIYFDSNRYLDPTASPPTPVTFNDGQNTYSPIVYQTFPDGTPREFFNNDSFQILSAGRDELWNTDDDLSNFWPGTRREYLDSLQD